MKKLTRIVCLMMALLLAAALVPATAEETSVTVTDMAGREVVVTGPVERLHVDWASGITLAMTLGATDKLVAVPTAFHADTFA